MVVDVGKRSGGNGVVEGWEVVLMLGIDFSSSEVVEVVVADRGRLISAGTIVPLLRARLDLIDRARSPDRSAGNLKLLFSVYLSPLTKSSRLVVASSARA